MNISLKRVVFRHARFFEQASRNRAKRFSTLSIKNTRRPTNKQLTPRRQCSTASSPFFESKTEWHSGLRTTIIAGCLALGTGVITSSTQAEDSTSVTGDVGKYRERLLKKGKLTTKRMHVFDPKRRRNNFDNVAVFSGLTNISLAEDIVHYLNTNLSEAKISKFADGETSVQLGVSCRGKNVFVIQSLCENKESGNSLNDSLMELLLMISAARRASAYRITAVVPYFAYARQNRKVPGSCVTIAIADVAQMLAAAGVDRVLTIDLHSAMSLGSFPNTVNVTNLLSQNIGAIYFSEKELHNPVVVSPKDGGINRAKTFAKALASNGYKNASFASFIKEVRPDGRSKRVLLGDVEGCDCIIVDDIIDTGTTIIKRAKNLKRAGAKNVFVFATHGVFSGNSEKLTSMSPYLDEIVVSDTIPFEENVAPEAQQLKKGVKDKPDLSNKVVRLSLAPLLAETIQRLIRMKSTSALTDNNTPSKQL